MRRLVLAAVILGAVSGARAADLSDLPILRGSFVDDGLSTVKVNWHGFYVGGQGGYGTSDMNFSGATKTVAAHLLFGTGIENEQQVSSWPLMGKVSVHGNGFGGFVGYNSQWEDVVVGAELNYLHGKFGGSASDSMARAFALSSGTAYNIVDAASASMSISDMGTIRARAGYAAGSFLPYMFGGVALGQADIVRTATISGTQNNIGFIPLTATDAQNSHLIYGYSAGLGVDVMLVSCLFLRAEWEYVRFTSSIDTSINTVRAGLGYKF